MRMNCSLGRTARRQSQGEHAPTILEGLRNAVGDRIHEVTTASYENPERARCGRRRMRRWRWWCWGSTKEWSEGADRPTLDLAPDQQDFLQRVVRANPLTIVVLEGGGPVGLEWLKACAGDRDDVVSGGTGWQCDRGDIDGEVQSFGAAADDLFSVGERFAAAGRLRHHARADVYVCSSRR